MGVGAVQTHTLVPREAKHVFIKKSSTSPSLPKLHQEVNTFAGWVGQPQGLRVPKDPGALTQSQKLNFKQRRRAAVPSSCHPSLVRPYLCDVIWNIFPGTIIQGESTVLIQLHATEDAEGLMVTSHTKLSSVNFLS